MLSMVAYGQCCTSNCLLDYTFPLVLLCLGGGSPALLGDAGAVAGSDQKDLDVVPAIVIHHARSLRPLQVFPRSRRFCSNPVAALMVVYRAHRAGLPGFGVLVGQCSCGVSVDDV